MLKAYSIRYRSLIPVVTSIGLLAAAPSVFADSGIFDDWRNAYPGSNSDASGCQLCHGSSTGDLNPYGNDLQCAGINFSSIEGLDSDGEGSSNLAEIDADAQPGWTTGLNTLYDTGRCNVVTGSSEAPTSINTDLDPTTVVLLPDIAVNPTSVNFGAVTIGFTSSDTVNIANVGDADLTVDSVSFSGSTSNEFDLINPPSTPFIVAANTSVNLTVEYAPANAGTDNGTLEIGSDSPNEELISVALVGTGVLPPVDECVAVVDPTSIDFGNVDVGTSATLSTTLTNTGTLDCVVGASLSGSIDFSLASASAFTVAPGNSASVDVVYSPLEVGDDSGTLLLDASGSEITVPLSGSGLAIPVLDLDIKSFRATGRISLKRVKEVDLKVSVQNNGVVEGSALATMTGMQNGVEVYRESMMVTDLVGGGSAKYVFPSYIPEVEGDILWTLVIDDVDPDDDVATDVTSVLP